MIIRKAQDRGRTQLEWLDGYHSFSFGEYHDTQWIHYGPLRVINDDRIAPGGGFGMHAHKDMEIITYVLDGSLAHKDSMGNEEVIPAGDIQMMRAGTGVRHSEYNNSKSDSVHLFQIWIMPQRQNLKPAYAQSTLDKAQRLGQWQLIVAPEGNDNAPIQIAQDAKLQLADVTPEHNLALPADAGRKYWLQVARGSVILDDVTLEAGDAAAFSAGEAKSLTSATKGGFVDLAA